VCAGVAAGVLRSPLPFPILFPPPSYSLPSRSRNNADLMRLVLHLQQRSHSSLPQKMRRQLHQAPGTSRSLSASHSHPQLTPQNRAAAASPTPNAAARAATTSRATRPTPASKTLSPPRQTSAPRVAATGSVLKVRCVEDLRGSSVRARDRFVCLMIRIVIRERGGGIVGGFVLGRGGEIGG
jgi:hypothetical protein